MITNCVPRELVRLSAFIEHVPDPVSAENLQAFTQSRTNFFQRVAEKYYRGLESIDKKRFYEALLQTFLHNTANVDFQWEFVDLGLVFRRKEPPYQQSRCHILCRPAQKALLGVFRFFDLPKDIKDRLRIGDLSGKEFEEALFHQLLCVKKPIRLKTTDLNNKNESTIDVDFDECITIKSPNVSLGQGCHNILSHGYPDYPRFDYMLGPKFFQVSVSDFQIHDTGSAKIEKAFEDRGRDGLNQIERYLNDMYGAGHSAKITNNRFVVTKGGVPVPGFRVVYIRGRPGKLSHPQLVKRLPDVAHIAFEEIREKLFKNVFDTD